MFSARKRLTLPNAQEALPGRPEPIPTAERHFVNGRALHPPFPEGIETVLFGLGCFWGAERKFWQIEDGHLGDRGRLCRRPDAQPDL